MGTILMSNTFNPITTCLINFNGWPFRWVLTILSSYQPRAKHPSVKIIGQVVISLQALFIKTRWTTPQNN